MHRLVKKRVYEEDEAQVMEKGFCSCLLSDMKSDAMIVEIV